MKMMTRMMAMLMAALMCLCATASAETVLKLGTTVNEQDSFQVAAEKFAELVEAGTDGAYKIEIYPNGTLGGEAEMLDDMSMGMLDMGIITSGPFVNFSEMMGVLDMPFLFANNEEAYTILDVMENEVYTKTFNALNVNTVPMAWADALTALQQGTIEGQENPINVFFSYSLWDYNQNYLALDRHSYSTAIITMSLDAWNTLDADTQQVFLDAAQQAAEYERQWVADQEADQLQAIKDHGVTVEENPDVDSFRDAVQVVYEAYPQYAGYLARIQEALAQ